MLLFRWILNFEDKCILNTLSSVEILTAKYIYSIRQHDHKTNLLALTLENFQTMTFIYTLCCICSMHYDRLFLGRSSCGFSFLYNLYSILKQTICSANLSPRDHMALWHTINGNTFFKLNFRYGLIEEYV